MRRFVGIPVVAVVFALAVAVALAASPAKITAAGVGKIKIGESYARLHARHLLGALEPGCPLAGSNTRAAKLIAPLSGFADLTTSTPRKVTDITVRGGARARGVGIGATIAQIKAKFPKAKVDHSTDHTFGVTIVRIPRNGGGKIEFSVSTSTHKTNEIGIPLIPFCE